MDRVGPRHAEVNAISVTRRVYRSDVAASRLKMETTAGATESTIAIEHTTGFKVPISKDMIAPTKDNLKDSSSHDAVHGRGAELFTNEFELNLHTKFPKDEGPSHPAVVNDKGAYIKDLASTVAEDIRGGTLPEAATIEASVCGGGEATGGGKRRCEEAGRGRRGQTPHAGQAGWAGCEQHQGQDDLSLWAAG